MEELTHEQKVRRDIMKQVNRGRIPYSGKRIKPIYAICGRCKKNKVTDHHFFCNKCHKEWDLERKILLIIKRWKVDPNNTIKIKNILYGEYKIYKSSDIIREYISNLIKRGVLKGGEKKWEQ